MPAKRTKPGTTAEAKKIHALLRRRRLPPSVRGFALEFGEDSTGDPAVWIWFEVDDDLRPSSRKLEELSELARSVTADILKKDFGRWPYVGFRVPA